MSTCGKVGSDVHAFTKELAIITVEHRTEIQPNESQHLSEGTKVARLQRPFFLFYNRHFHCARVVISADREWPLRVSDSSIRNARCLQKRIVTWG